MPAGSALAVDRGLFARKVTAAVEALPGVTLARGEVERIPDDPVTIVATGPLTSDPLARDVAAFVGQTHLYFYDAVSPVVEADSIDFAKTFRASRYGKGGDDYVNCPLDERQYRAFYEALTTAECATLHAFEHEFFFEGCLPVEVIASRGPETLRFGPMKPVGLVLPATGQRPHAVVQLRQDNLAASHFSIVGFQTQLKWGEQKRVFRLIPGLENAEFLSSCPVPDSNGGVRAARREMPAVGAERYPVNRPLMVREGLDFLAGRRIPDPHDEIPSRRGDVPAVRTERHAESIGAVTRKAANLFRGCDIPHANLLSTPTRHRQAPTVGAVG